MPVQNGDLIELSDIVQQGEEEVYLPLLPQNQAEIDLMQQLMNYMSKSSHPRVVVSFIKSTWNS
jgi:predicted transcriptional regulator